MKSESKSETTSFAMHNFSLLRSLESYSIVYKQVQARILITQPNSHPPARRRNALHRFRHLQGPQLFPFSFYVTPPTNLTSADPVRLTLILTFHGAHRA